ncbi:Amylo-alpha-16-glucosidase [Gemmatirosa kalamazoonensis]|uniref:Amylo-alpha-16-glucosidase n=1 Tax=Gemmatirosa kalamazoonensis TaxID=861299 RepID=W0RGE5_9BACT|nr:amylo-alpha-1,6-glucosidase [Gemmatirosa kalamazoonensis]AHG89405.1 Amylo-alpha-16-glucosidase [Gemmatirosa kalamazoonensis]
MNPAAEWLEADGLGGFASGRADGVRTRRYHALLLAAASPPTERAVLVNGFDATVRTPDGEWAISSQRYTPDVTAPDGATHLASFTVDPWPTWTYRLPNGIEIVQELLVLRGAPVVALSWRLSGLGTRDSGLVVRPFLSGRDTHATHHANGAFDFTPRVEDDRVRWQPYADRPAVVAASNGRYAHEPVWYHNFQYDEERARGLDFVEDLAAPGTFTFDLSAGRAVLVLAADLPEAAPWIARPADACWRDVERAERARRSSFRTPLHRAAEDYVVRRGAGKTIVAGYPWFSDWGRDTFIAMRGLCIAGGRLDDARDILLEWSRHVSEGMLPNYFPEGGQPAEYNAVDASLWFCVTVHETLHASGADLPALRDAVEAIVSGYAAGTRFGIRMDDDGLLAAGVPGVQLTWMDARVDGREITPRIGKPVEVQALWINALRIAAAREPRWNDVADRASAAFTRRFWNEARGCLFDVVDVDHVPDTADASLRPNQLLAVGGLPWVLVDGARARRIVDACERALWTVAGPRSLAPGEPGYIGTYGGDMRRRDGAYHQGTVWPWLAGPFVDAWVRVHSDTPEAREEARTRFLEPLVAHYAATTPGHLAEIADAEPPHAPRGCPFQAWSVGEALRLSQELASNFSPSRCISMACERTPSRATATW